MNILQMRAFEYAVSRAAIAENRVAELEAEVARLRAALEVIPETEVPV